jgi:phage antirepressor YoqD-like protein
MSALPIQSANGAPTMTSLELVDFINSHEGRDDLTHANFMAKVPKVLGGGVIQFQETYIHPQNGQSYPCYRFPKREACLMAMSYSYELQARVFDRMTALEQASNDPVRVLSDPAAMRGLLLSYTERVITLEGRVQELAPKADICDRISGAEGSVSLREACTTLRVPERKFVLWLQQHDWCYRRAGHKSLLPYADKVKSGLLYLKQTPIQDIHSGEARLSEQVRVTPLGLTVLARKTVGLQDAA